MTIHQQIQRTGHQHVQAVNPSFQIQFLGGLSRLPQPVLQAFHPEHEEPRRPRESTTRLPYTVQRVPSLNTKNHFIFFILRIVK
jgi:hypothetical protein